MKQTKAIAKPTPVRAIVQVPIDSAKTKSKIKPTIIKGNNNIGNQPNHLLNSTNLNPLAPSACILARPTSLQTTAKLVAVDLLAVPQLNLISFFETL